MAAHLRCEVTFTAKDGETFSVGILPGEYRRPGPHGEILGLYSQAILRLEWKKGSGSVSASMEYETVRFAFPSGNMQEYTRGEIMEMVRAPVSPPAPEF